jgi:hypothetical protein
MTGMRYRKAATERAPSRTAGTSRAGPGENGKQLRTTSFMLAAEH